MHLGIVSVSSSHFVTPQKSTCRISVDVLKGWISEKLHSNFKQGREEVKLEFSLQPENMM